MGEPLLPFLLTTAQHVHMMQYGEPPARRAVPLAVAALFISNPEMPPVDMLARLSHDTDAEVAQNAVMALGLVGAGACWG